MKKAYFILSILVLLVGCQDIWDSTTAGNRLQATRSQRLADERQMLVMEKFVAMYAEAEKKGDTELCLKILEAYVKYSSQVEPSSSSQEYDSQQWLQHQQTMNQLRQMEHKASFDRMMRGGLP